jgi:hypothetical protein
MFTCIVVPLSAQQEIIYFYEEGCSQCENVSLLLDELSQEYALTIIRYDVGTAEGFAVFKQHGFTVTPALIIDGKKLEGEIERTNILRALQHTEWYHFLAALVLGVVSGFSPTLMKMHAGIITEVARTTRQETDVVVRSLLFYAGILCSAGCLSVLFAAVDFLHFVAVLFGVVISVNLLNSGLHSFNSYTNVDLYMRTHLIRLEPDSVLKVGFVHGVAKFSDSVPMFLPLLYLIITRGSFAEDITQVLLFCGGIVLTYCTLFALALVQVNLFRIFREELASQLYFSVSGLLVMATSVWLLWEILNSIDVGPALILTVMVVVISGALIGFKRRIIL